MRAILIVVTAAALFACGEVKSFHDAGSAGDDVIDGGGEVDCASLACGEDDGCCPPGCHTGNDPDCEPVCDNGILEAGETCDPLSSCPAACPDIGCTLRSLSGAGTCQAACVVDGPQMVCQSGDGCCPTGQGCTLANDAECGATCDNGIPEAGETCDPLSSCPTSCPQESCDTFTLFNEGSCQAACVDTGDVSACVDNDGCCPSACNANNDNNCEPDCGNGVVEPGELCEGAGCSCGSELYSCFTSVGSVATCDVECHIPQQSCGEDDDCCPYRRDSDGTDCTASTDPQCRGSAWRVIPWYQGALRTYASCNEGGTTIRIHNVQARDSLVITTCSPDGGGRGDARIQSIVDSNQNSYPLNSLSDDCPSGLVVPRMHGFRCNNADNQERQACASPNTGGFIIRDGAQYLDVNICSKTVDAGALPLYFFVNGEGAYNPG